MSADNRASLLSLVRPQIDATLAQVQEAMATHVAQNAGNSALAACSPQLHQVCGALRMVRLEGATRYGTELESALRNAMRSGAADKTEIENISRGITALREFSAEVAAGGANTPLRLFPAYRDLARVSGNESASEKDLFFPDPTCDTPAHADPRNITPSVIPALLKELRSRYQRGLLGWLKESAKPDGLVQMHDVLDMLHKISAGLPEPRGLWWAGIALIDAAIEALPDPLQADWIARVKPACSRIDFLLRDLAVQAHADTHPAQRDVLYAIALSRSANAQLQAVRACFSLDSLVPAAQSAGAAAAIRLKPALDDVRARFENIKETWTEYASGEPKRLQRFHDMLTALTEKSRELSNGPLAQLFEAIGAATVNLPDPYPLDGQIMSLEMASALLMAESIVHHLDALPDDLEQQVTIMRGWLNDAAQGKATTTSPPGLRPDIVQKVNDANLRIATAREILKSLGQVEKTIEAFTRDHTQHATLTPLVTNMRQVSGVFQVSNQKRASRLATVCQRLIERCAVAGHVALDQDIEWVAEGLGSLGFYLEPCQYGKLPAERAVNMFFMRYEQQAGNDAILTLTQSMPAVAPTVPAEPVAAPFASLATSAPAHDGMDREMLDVFLEEASEVLAAIETSNAQLRKNGDDHDALLNVRRAFHTLKGSARMVGLPAFGECAWEMEQAMNHWRGQSLAATPELLTLVKDARELLAEWTHALQDAAAPDIDASNVTARARALRGAPDTAETPVAPVPPVDTSAAVSLPTPVLTQDFASPAAREIPVTSMPAALAAGSRAAPTGDFMTLMVSQPAATPPVPDIAESTGSFMTMPQGEPAVPPALVAPASGACEQTLADLGDRLAWLSALIDEMQTEAALGSQTPPRLREVAHMMQESMAEAGALHRALGNQVAALTRRT